MPALEFFSKNHKPGIGKNSLTKDMVSANEGLQGVLAKSGHMEAIWKEAVEGHQVDRLKLDRSCIITLVVYVILIGLMWVIWCLKSIVLWKSCLDVNPLHPI